MAANVLVDMAVTMLKDGYSVIPTGDNKAAAFKWGMRKDKPYEPEHAVFEFQKSRVAGIALLGGEISGGVEILDIDDTTIRDQIHNMVIAGCSQFIDRLVLTKTPKGAGIIYRCTERPTLPSHKVCRDKIEVDGLGEWDWIEGRKPQKCAKIDEDGKYYIKPVRVETRGRGAYSLIYPSKNYEIVQGSFEGLEPITWDQRMTLVNICMLFDRTGEGYQPPNAPKELSDDAFLPRIPSVWDMFNQDIDRFREQLEEDGWTQFRRHAGKTEYLRPGGKDHAGAILYDDGGLYMMTSSTDGLEPEKMYRFYDYYTLVHANGKTSVTDKYMRSIGYQVELNEKELLEIVTANPTEIEKAFRLDNWTDDEIFQFIEDHMDLWADGGLDEDLVGGDSENVVQGDFRPDGKDSASSSSSDSGKAVKGESEGGDGFADDSGPDVPRAPIENDEENLHLVVRKLDKALATNRSEGGYYNWKGSLGMVDLSLADDPDEKQTLVFHPFKTSTIRTSITQVATAYVKKKEKGETIKAKSKFSGDTLQALLDAPRNTANRIKAFVSHPVIGKEGQALGLDGEKFSQGYVFREQFKGVKIDDRDFKGCFDRIVELFCSDIEFENPELGQALFVGMMIAALSRVTARNGECPGFFITSNEVGSGKSTVFEMISHIVYGESGASLTWLTKEEERLKRITGKMKNRQVEYILHDNIKRGTLIDCDTISQAITSNWYEDRILGGNEIYSAPANLLWVFIGNNLEMSADFSRRLCTLRLMAQSSNPENRNFKIKNVAKFCRTHRAEVLGCLLKMIQEGNDMDNIVKEPSGFAWFDQFIRNPMLKQIEVDIADAIKESKTSVGEKDNVSRLIQSCEAIFCDETGETFTMKQVELVVQEPGRFTDEKYSAEELAYREMKKESREEIVDGLREVILALNGRALQSNKSLGRVFSGNLGRWDVDNTAQILKCGVRRGTMHYIIRKNN